MPIGPTIQSAVEDVHRPCPIGHGQTKTPSSASGPRVAELYDSVVAKTAATPLPKLCHRSEKCQKLPPHHTQIVSVSADVMAPNGIASVRTATSGSAPAIFRTRHTCRSLGLGGRRCGHSETRGKCIAGDTILPKPADWTTSTYSQLVTMKDPDSQELLTGDIAVSGSGASAFSILNNIAR
jgi:hypothetical protein